MGFTRRITEVESEDGWKQVSSRLERWSPSEQVFPASAAMLSLLDSPEYSRLYNKYYEIFELDGGANLTGVDSVVVEGKKRSRLILAVEDCPELWKYSNVLKDRVIEEYED